MSVDPDPHVEESEDIRISRTEKKENVNLEESISSYRKERP